MTDSSFTWESIGEYKLQIGSGCLVFIGGIFKIIPPMAIGGVVIMGAFYFFGKPAYEAYQKFELKKWLQTQLECETVTPELKEKYVAMLAKFI